MSNVGLSAYTSKYLIETRVYSAYVRRYWPIMILIVQRWIICAYEQIPHRNMSVFCVRTQIFMIMDLVFQCWVICAYNQVHRGCILRADIPNNYLSSNAGLFAQVHRHMDVFYVRTQIFLIIILIAQRWIICAYELIP